ncbi:Gamma-tubulin complex component 3 [Thelohanellus kitauei]|uniref:Gamma-tubulin complex component 3 n=1 Tax=Thelohanellus kitauei TaxID=669202 RepID=A0A0C2MEW8_THEKT|nr:Gamma-tubulin complex component 3 [Thelohanellus kitauei]
MPPSHPADLGVNIPPLPAKNNVKLKSGLSLDIGHKDEGTLFTKDLLSQLEINAHTSPWALINHKLRDGQREVDILSDLVYIVQGIDSLNIKFDISTQKYILSPKVDIPGPVKQIVLHICELGYLFRQLTEISSSEQPPDMGMVKKAFNLSVKSYLNDFIHFVASIDTDLGFSSQRELGLPQFLVATMEFERKFIFLYNAVKKCEGLSGGALLSTLYNFSQTGDYKLSAIGFNLLIEVRSM